MQNHKPVKTIMNLNIKSTNVWQLKHQLKLVRYIDQFHTTNLYTVNYGKYGKITFKRKGKVLERYFSIKLYNCGFKQLNYFFHFD